MTYVLIHWIDSAGPNGWVFDEDFDPIVAKCVTLGILLAETDESITVTSTFVTNGPAQSLSPITIPKIAITNRWDLDVE